MKSIVLQGPFLTTSGYGEHARQLARWVLSKPVDVKFIVTPWGDTPWLLNRDSCDGLVNDIMTRTIDPGSLSADVSLQLQLPNEWNPRLARKNVGLSAIVETDRCSPDWVKACNMMDVVVVPSNHAAQCLKNSGTLNVRLHVVPESYKHHAVDKTSLSLDDVSTSFNFLVFGQLTGNNPHNDRKNTFNTVKWICESFSNDPDVGIVLKTNVGRNTLIDRNIVMNILKRLVNEVKRGPYPKIHLLHGNMSDDDVCALYRSEKIKALVSLTRGEGFGLPILEAATCGLPVIATNWSGHLDFMSLGKFINVTYNLMPIHSSRIDNKIFIQGAKWAEPDEQDAKKKLRKFRSSPTLPQEWAKDLQKTITERFSPERINLLYDAALGDLIAD